MANLVFGAGPIGQSVIDQLIANGEPVVVATRTGSGPEHPLVQRLQVDAADAQAVKDVAADATVIYHCIHTAYSEKAWRRDLFGPEQAVLAAAAEHNLTVVFPESLYGFDPSVMPLRETTPLNAETGKRGVRAELLAARAQHKARSRSVVAGDYFGPHARETAHAGSRMIDAVLSGNTVRPFISADQPHAFTYLPDLAAAMSRAAKHPGEGHQLLFAPTAPSLTQRELIEAFAQAAGKSVPKVSALPAWGVHTLATVHPLSRSLAEVIYQFGQPFTMDSIQSEALLGLHPTPLDSAARASIDWYRAQRFGR
jgi:nucleoside-diphosphate-sugar epimerase